MYTSSAVLSNAETGIKVNLRIKWNGCRVLPSSAERCFGPDARNLVSTRPKHSAVLLCLGWTHMMCGFKLCFRLRLWLPSTHTVNSMWLEAEQTGSYAPA